jgi:hypothetical protein
VELALHASQRGVVFGSILGASVVGWPMSGADGPTLSGGASTFNGNRGHRGITRKAIRVELLNQVTRVLPTGHVAVSSLSPLS